jgi:hypothetical protein
MGRPTFFNQNTQPALHDPMCFGRVNPWIPWAPMESMGAPMATMGTHGFHGHPWKPWVPMDSMAPTTHHVETREIPRFSERRVSRIRLSIGNSFIVFNPWYYPFKPSLSVGILGSRKTYFHTLQTTGKLQGVAGSESRTVFRGPRPQNRKTRLEK